jgi:hypothetical protein
MLDHDFTKNCVFIDEAAFNLCMQRGYGRFVKGTSAKGNVPTETCYIQYIRCDICSGSHKHIAEEATDYYV